MSKTVDQALGDPAGPAVPTRERLLRAAVAVGARDGWAGMTTRAVATAAGVIPGVVHYHLGSVAALRREAVRTALETLAVEVRAQVTDAVDPEAAILAVVRAATEATPSDATALVHEAYLAAAREPEVRDLLAEQVSAFRAWVADWLDERTAHHADRQDPAALAAALVAAVDGLYLHHVLDPTFDPSSAAGPLIRALVGGGTAPAGTGAVP